MRRTAFFLFLFLNFIFLSMVAGWSARAQDSNTFTLRPLPFAAVSSDDLWLYGFTTFPQQIDRDVQFFEQEGFGGYPSFQGEWSPDGNLFAYRKYYPGDAAPPLNFESGSIVVFDRRDDTSREVITELPGGMTPFTFSLDSKSLIFSRDALNNVVYESIDLTVPGAGAVPFARARQTCGPGGGGGGSSALTSLRYWSEIGFMGDVQTIRMTPIGLFFDAMCDGRIFGIVNPQTSERIETGVFTRAAFSVTRRYAAGIDENGGIKFLSLTDLQAQPIILNPTDTPDVLAISSDGSAVYYSTRTPQAAASNEPGNTVYIVSIRKHDVTTGNDTELYSADAFAVGRMTLTPDDQELIFSVVPNLPVLSSELNVSTSALRDAVQTELYRLNLADNTSALIGRDLNSFALNPVAYMTGFEGPVVYAAPGSSVSVSPTLSPDTTPIRRERISASNVGDLALIAVLQRLGIDETLWSPGGRALAVSGGNSVWLYDTINLDAEPRELTHIDTVVDIAFNPDGRLLATAINGAVTIWYVQDGSVRDNILLEAQDMTYSPDGSLLAYVSPFGDVGWFNTLTRETRVLRRGNGPPAPVGLHFSRRGETLAVGNPDGTVDLYDVSTAAIRQTLGTPFDSITAEPNGQNPSDGLAYSEDGRFIASVDLAAPRGLNLWSAEDGALVHRASANDETVYAAEFNLRAGIMAAVVGNATDGRQNRVILSGLANPASEIAALPHAGARNVTFSTDGTLLATAGNGELRLWGLASGLPTPSQARTFSNMNVVAACDSYGIAQEAITSTQSVSLVWSWYAASDELVRDHINAAHYTVTLDGAAITGWQYLTRTEADPINENNPTVYWYAPIGRLSPGTHTSAYTLTWARPIHDGFGDYGPGTAYEQDSGSCQFVVG